MILLTGVLRINVLNHDFLENLGYMDVIYSTWQKRKPHFPKTCRKRVLRVQP